MYLITTLLLGVVSVVLSIVVSYYFHTPTPDGSTNKKCTMTGLCVYTCNRNRVDGFSDKPKVQASLPDDTNNENGEEYARKLDLIFFKVFSIIVTTLDLIVISSFVYGYHCV